MTSLDCNTNLLTSLDVRNTNNTEMISFSATTNPNLTCIFVDDTTYSATNWTNIDSISTFVNNETECTEVTIEGTKFELTVYPNPTGSYLFIEGNETPISISIYNILGEKVITAQNTNKVNVKELLDGVFIIKITDGVNQVNKKFVKN